MKTKQELEQAVLMLEEQVATNKTMSETYQQDLEKAKKDLADMNKPELTGHMYDIIFEAIEDSIGYFDFSDSENYDIEYELDYDGRVNASSIELNSAQELVENIMRNIEKSFKVPHTEE